MREYLDADEAAAKLQGFIANELEGRVMDSVQIAAVIADIDDRTMVIIGNINEALMPMLLIEAANSLTTERH